MNATLVRDLVQPELDVLYKVHLVAPATVVVLLIIVHVDPQPLEEQERSEMMSMAKRLGLTLSACGILLGLTSMWRHVLRISAHGAVAHDTLVVDVVLTAIFAAVIGSQVTLVLHDSLDRHIQSP